MYTPVVMTEAYRVVRKAQSHAEIEDAKKAAKEMQLESGQMHAVIDQMNLVRWKGGIKATAKRSARNTA